MRISFLVMVIIALTVSCSSNSEKNNGSEKEMKVMIPKSGCYASFSGKDTILLKIEVFPNVVTGILKYQVWEKDKNEGTIEGKLSGDTLFANYTFTSEGQTSVREVAFLLNNHQAIEGFGGMEEKNRKMVFTDKSQINFSKGAKLSPIDCVENDSLFRLGVTGKKEIK